VRESDGPRSALERAGELAAEARSQLDNLPASPAVSTLVSLTEYVVSRKF